MKNKIKLFIFSILSFLAILSPVSASSLVDYTALSYGYHYINTSGNSVAYQWTGYNTNYMQRSSSDLPSTLGNNGILVEDIGIRFRIDGGFIKDHNYVITFEWTNQNAMYGNYDWYTVFSEMQTLWTCRASSWSDSSIEASNCFSSGYYFEKQNLTLNSILITVHFTASRNMYGMSLYWSYPSSATNHSYYSQGWSVGPVSYEDISDSSQAIIDNQNQNTQNIINNQNSNTNSVINNQNQNTQNIINNQNANSQSQIDSQMSCDLLPISSYIYSGSLTSSGTVNNQSGFKYTDYIKIDNKSKISLVEKVFTGNSFLCFYTVNKEVISCFSQYDLSSNDILTIPNNASYFRATLNLTYNKPTWKICKNGNQAVTDTLTDDNVSGANSDAGNFFSGFTESDHGGLSAIVTAPLVVVNSMLTNNTCQDLRFQVMGADVSFPSGCILWNLADSTIVTLWRTIVCGFVSYLLLKKMFKDIENLKNPGNSEVSTLDL